MTLSPLSDSAIVLAFGGPVDDEMLARVNAVAAALRRHPPRGVVDVLPAFAQVTVFYDITQSEGYERLADELRLIAENQGERYGKSGEPRRVEIPVCYGAELGPDLDAVAAHAGLSTTEVIALHSGADYRVHAIGFAPGFAYLGGLPRPIAVPRHPTPRTAVPAGAVGIGGSQTGVYPLVTPGGWNLIGRTPLHLFDPERTESALLQAGDRVKFRAITPEEFRLLENGARAVTDPRELARREASNSGPAVPGPIEVLKAGMWTTVQDAGRIGHRARGVPLGGGADSFAVRLVNWLVGNAADCAVLEFTLIGPELRFTRDTMIALGGAEFGLLPRWQPIQIEAGSVIKMGVAGVGCRGYLAIAGGIDVPVVLGSRSTYARAAFGGFEGRALRDGDSLGVREVGRRILGHWHIDERILPIYSPAPAVRVVRGAQAEEFAASFFAATFKVSAQSDRMGVRLTGPSLQRKDSLELASSAVVPGTVQIPPDGHPIVLMADAQTLGGYPQVAHVIAVDLPIVAQLKPGDTLRFREVTLAEAHQLTLEREHALAILQAGLAQKFA